MQIAAGCKICKQPLNLFVLFGGENIVFVSVFVFQSQNHKEHRVGEPGAHRRGVEEEVREGEGEESQSQHHDAETGE